MSDGFIQVTFMPFLVIWFAVDRLKLRKARRMRGRQGGNKSEEEVS